jgi:hypothetical protein
MSMAMRVDGTRGARVSAAESMAGGFGDPIAQRALAHAVCRVWTVP